jgi:hypothetical protein
VRIADLSPKTLLGKLGHVHVQWLCTRLDWTYHRWVGRPREPKTCQEFIHLFRFPCDGVSLYKSHTAPKTDERTQT